jgi:glycosyltransferase involved in cell wall biosynthesis
MSIQKEGVIHTIHKEVRFMTFRRIPKLVSVIVPAYNNAGYIKACLNSLIRQSYQHLEIIIINDGSKDSTGKVIKSWKRSLRIPLAKKNHIILVNLPRNIGFAGAVHTGLFMAKGEYIAIQDADDLSHPQRISKQVRFLTEHPEVDLVGTNYASFPNGTFHKQTMATWLKYGEEIIQSYARGEHCICHGTILFRTSVFDQLGGHTRKIEGAEDYEFIAKCVASGFAVENIPDVLYYYRNHKDQRSKQYYP